MQIKIKQVPTLKKSPKVELDIHKKNIEEISISHSETGEIKINNATLLQSHGVSTTGKYLDVNNNINCSSFHVSSDGDIIKRGNINGCHIVEIDLSETSQKQMEDLAIYASDNEKSSFNIRKPKAIINNNMIDICEINLGYWQKYYDKNTSINNLFVGKRTYYDKITGIKKDDFSGGNIKYRVMIMCEPENKDMAIAKIKEIAKQDIKLKIDWFI